MAFGLEAIDWSVPWLGHLRQSGEGLAQQAGPQASVAQVLGAALLQYPQTPIRFVAQACLPSGVAYEQFIYETRQVPTRDGLHDFFNGLCWLAFPQTKTQLNRLQAQEIARLGVQATRGPVRDALTLFDENAAFLQAPDALWEALLAKDWQRLFVTLRPMWSEAYLLLFGHALLEKLVAPRKPITAHVYRAYAAINSVASVDGWVAELLAGPCATEHLASKPFAHLPVLGVPLWWAANAQAGFYDDTSVFRPPRPLQGAR